MKNNFIGIKIKNLRIKKGWSQTDLAKKYYNCTIEDLSNKQKEISRIENGRYVTDSELKKFANVFDCSLSEFQHNEKRKEKKMNEKERLMYIEMIRDKDSELAELRRKADALKDARIATLERDIDDCKKRLEDPMEKNGETLG